MRISDQDRAAVREYINGHLHGDVESDIYDRMKRLGRRKELCDLYDAVTMLIDDALDAWEKEGEKSA